MSRNSLTWVVASVALVNLGSAQQQSGVQAIRPDEIKWGSFAWLPAGAQRAVVFGDPSKPGQYVVRLRSPQGQRIMPHTHREDRIYTVLSGTFYLGVGDSFDEAKLQAYPSGSVIFLPAKLSHYQYAKAGAYEVQIDAVGPTDITYVNPSDDPRNAAK